MDQKSLETVFSIVTCRLRGDKWKSKTLFLSILILITFSIATYPVCLYKYIDPFRLCAKAFFAYADSARWATGFIIEAPPGGGGVCAP